MTLESSCDARTLVVQGVFLVSYTLTHASFLFSLVVPVSLLGSRDLLTHFLVYQSSLFTHVVLLF